MVNPIQLRQEATALLKEAQELALSDTYGGEQRAQVDQMMEDARLKRERAAQVEALEEVSRGSEVIDTRDLTPAEGARVLNGPTRSFNEVLRWKTTT